MPTPFVKKLIVFFLVLVLVPTTIISAAPVIKDAALAKVIRGTLKISAKKEVKTSDLRKLKSLYAEDTQKRISNLQGLENAVNLVDLMLPSQNIKNITPLRKLTKLTFLVLEGNQITDLSPLSGLTNLNSLLIDGNQIKSLTPLKNLHKLTSLLASNNQVTDLKPLQKLKLEWMIMSGNKIRDLTPLKNHPTLQYLYLDSNLIQDIAVLETIPHLQEVSLADNPLNEHAEQVVKKLEKKGVMVSLENDEADKRE
ncbi:leucine-rich repeat domain-containing protein [Paenibacillus sp. QZ-Y1]|uniref:leucine-rich repeat domain-containing protein n=1 Tax=Paenibacillus sp. QZ-Y1 TaxID=3414511 RepID=UPI003F79BC6B